MRATPLMTTALIAGFMAGSWTPLGQTMSRQDVANGLFVVTAWVTERNAEATGEATSDAALNRFRTLIAAAQKEPGGNILQNHGIVMAAGFLDPEAAWAMHYSELERTDGVALAAWSGPANEEASQAPKATGNRDTNLWHSRTSAVELARLRATIAGIRGENAAIETSLAALDPSHPDHAMALCIHASNQGLVAFYTFLTTMGENGVTGQETTRLATTLTALLGDAGQHAAEGRRTAQGHIAALKALPADTAGDQHIRAQALEYYESFILSFDLEDTLAAHLATYPAHIENAIATRTPPGGVSAWVQDFQELGRSRMELQAYRQTIASRLAGPAV